MCIDNFNTWFETLKVKAPNYSFGSEGLKGSYVLECLRREFEECFNSAFEAGKDQTNDKIISSLESKLDDIGYSVVAMKNNLVNLRSSK